MTSLDEKNPKKTCLHEKGARLCQLPVSKGSKTGAPFLSWSCYIAVQFSLVPPQKTAGLCSRVGGCCPSSSFSNSNLLLGSLLFERCGLRPIGLLGL